MVVATSRAKAKATGKEPGPAPSGPAGAIRFDEDEFGLGLPIACLEAVFTVPPWFEPSFRIGGGFAMEDKFTIDRLGHQESPTHRASVIAVIIAVRLVIDLPFFELLFAEIA